MPQLQISETQVIKMARQLTPKGKRALLSSLILFDLGNFEQLVPYGQRKIRQICANRGMDWDTLTEAQRERLIDDMLHEE